jgi:predicted lipid-binding transport protein (Tim44 family)
MPAIASIVATASTSPTRAPRPKPALPALVATAARIGPEAVGALDTFAGALAGGLGVGFGFCAVPSPLFCGGAVLVAGGGVLVAGGAVLVPAVA